MRLLNIAPHASLPPMDGADNRTWHLYEGMVNQGAKGTFVGRTVMLRGLGKPQRHSISGGWRNQKLVAALAASVAGRDYRQLKHLLPGSRKLIQELSTEPFDAVLVNFLFALPMANPWMKRGASLIVDTHNYDPGWFDSLATSSRNPMVRHLCKVGVRHTHQLLAGMPKGALLVHVSESDARRYRERRPEILDHVVVENGASVLPRAAQPAYDSPERRVLIFVGSLSARMNQDALGHFANRFWPSLGKIAEFRVVGSAPPENVRRLCREHGWALFPNVTSAELDKLYSEAHFAVLPFQYGEGSKLKFLEACGRGVPVLATRAGLAGMASVPRTVTQGDDPQAWSTRIRTLRKLEDGDSRELISFAERFSWKVLSSKLFQILSSRCAQHANSNHN